ncbi:sigma factor [Thomasclavelia sp.]|uniref:sigma factor n=1 Tax=Thomasclavelia sp. TaxID=3025757 RepID=UPI0025D8ABFF|nr:sigma factor [Thomasclavelia sp.]
MKDGYDIEELYYLYLQECPIATKYLVEYVYDQIGIILSKQYLSMIEFNEQDECIQIVITRIFKSLNNYRPDKGMSVRSFISLIIDNSLKSVIIKRKGKFLRERKIQYSLDDFYDFDKKDTYITNLTDFKTPAKAVSNANQLEHVEKHLMSCTSELEKTIFSYRKAGYRCKDIAKILKVDVRSVYNANYRIQKKMARFKSI